MHAPWRGGREPRRAEKQPEPESAEPSRVESSRVAARGTIGACATAIDASVCTLLARSLAKLTREPARADRRTRGTYGYVIHWRQDTGASTESPGITINFTSAAFIPRKAKE